MEELGFWTGFGSGLYLGMAISFSLTMVGLLAIAAVRNPRRDYGNPDLYNVTDFSAARSSLPDAG